MSFEEALNTILSGVEIELTVRYAQGKKQGDSYTKRCRYGAPDGYDRSAKNLRIKTQTATTVRKDSCGEGGHEAKQRRIGRHVDEGTLPMTDVSDNKYFSPNIYHITHVNGSEIWK